MKTRNRTTLKRRLQALEKRVIDEPAILLMQDGESVNIPGSGDSLLRLLFCEQEKASPKQVERLDRIKRSVSSKEPAGGRMIELIRCKLDGPVPTPARIKIEQYDGNGTGKEAARTTRR